MVNVKWLLRRKYPAEPLRQALQDYFGERRLGESTKRLIIPSYDSVRGDVYLYKTPHHERLKTDYKELAWSVALATASAPTYFPASIDDAGVRLIDGGVWANNPSMVALAEALGYLGQAQDSLAMLSMGTTQEAVTSMDKHITGGLWTWRQKALEFVMAGQSRAAENQCSHILGKERFLRVNPVVARHYALDKMSLELEGIGRTEARNAVNEVESMFLHNQAAPYQPLYSLKDCQDKHQYSKEEESNVD
jgi:patatin-like phospholipase/acyl hydrolase